MKETTDKDKLDSILRSSRIVAGGFMGDDGRDVSEIIKTDTAAVAQMGYTLKQIAVRMQEITDQAKAALGGEVTVSGDLRAFVDEAKGKIVCPWPHPESFDKRLTTVSSDDLQDEIVWSDLHIHLIGEHGFFEGIDSSMRIEPELLIRFIFEIE
jgi:hypothetical protein